MAFGSAQQSRVILGDFPLSSYVRKVDAEASTAMGDTTVLTSGGEEMIPVNQSGKLSFAGLLDSDGSAAGQNRQIFDQLSVLAMDAVSYAPFGFARGNPVQSCLAAEDSYALSNEEKSPISWTMSVVANGGFDLGISLADLAVITVDTNGTAVDNAASTANGGIAYLHVAAYSGFTSVAFKVQHSTDNSSWSDLASFTSVTGKTSERKLVAGGTTVNRYLRSFADVTGSGSVTFQMSFARR